MKLGYVVARRGTAWMGRAWDPAAKCYRSRSFDKEGEAKAWAKEQHAKFVAKVESAGRLKTRALVTDYLAELRRLGRSEVHHDDTRFVLEQWATEVPDASALNAKDRTVAWLSAQRHLAPATRNRYLVAVKAVCKWAVLHGRLPASPVAVLKKEKVPDLAKAQFTVEELQQIACADGDPYHVRACLLLYAGLRVDEAAEIEWRHVDLAGRVLTVFGKGQKERLVPIQGELLPHLEDLRKASPDDADRLFPDAAANKQREFAGFLRRLRLAQSDRTPHSLRHCYAGLMTATGLPSILLASYMGHASQQTTAGYSQLAARYVSSVAGWQRGEFRLRSCLVQRR